MKMCLRWKPTHHYPQHLHRLYVLRLKYFPKLFQMALNYLTQSSYHLQKIQLSPHNHLDGYVEIVEFFGDDNLIGSDSSEPFGIVWENISVGEHTIYVNAVDNDGLVSTSSTFSFEVIQAPVLE